VLVLDSLDTVEDLEEGFLQDLCVPCGRGVLANGPRILIQLCSRLLAHLLKVLATPPGAHGTSIVRVKDLVALLQLDARVLARHDNGAAGLAGAHLGALQGLVRGAGGIVAVDGRGRGA
jgi:hypothetical protein